MRSPARIANVLSIAGSDPSGGAGLQADLKTFAALGCYGMAVPTALTAQNTRGVTAIHLIPPEFVEAQLAALFDDIAVDAIKIGMLGSAGATKVVAEALKVRAHLPIVLDPVLVSTSGATLADAETIDALRTALFPLAHLVTPNAAEAAVLSGTVSLKTEAEMQRAALALHGGGTTAWLVKGGHVSTGTDGSLSSDLLIDRQGKLHWFRSPRIATRNTHGTGCTLSAAIAAHLGSGMALGDAVNQAKAFIDGALASADRLNVGQGSGPLDHTWQQRRS